MKLGYRDVGALLSVAKSGVRNHDEFGIVIGPNYAYAFRPDLMIIITGYGPVDLIEPARVISYSQFKAIEKCWFAQNKYNYVVNFDGDNVTIEDTVGKMGSFPVTVDLSGEVRTPPPVKEMVEQIKPCDFVDARVDFSYYHNLLPIFKSYGVNDVSIQSCSLGAVVFFDQALRVKDYRGAVREVMVVTATNKSGEKRQLQDFAKKFGVDVPEIDSVMGDLRQKLSEQSDQVTRLEYQKEWSDNRIRLLEIQLEESLRAIATAQDIAVKALDRDPASVKEVLRWSEREKTREA